MSSSASFGGAPHHAANNSTATPAAAHMVGTSSPNHAVLTRNDDGGGGGSHASPPTGAFQRQHNLVHDAPPQHAFLQHHQPREIIELTDSDTDSAARNKGPANAGTASLLQAAFDPIPRPPATSSNRASIASLINSDHPPPAKRPRSSNPSPTSLTHVSDTNGTKKPEKSKPAEISTERSPKSSRPATTNNSSAPSPKAIRPVVPTSSGNGLLGNVFSGGAGASEEEWKVPSICLHVPLNGESNKYVNFAKLAEDRYGWAALNPRLAKAKMQMDSGDENMVDGFDSESNVEMGGTGETTAEGPKKRKRRRYQDVYDQEDPFIDDSETLWQDQAAASKDGFFVYSGPLVPEGEKPQIERADGTVKRGRGRGRGSRGGTASARGGGTTARKPRITKKEKEKLEKEKEERERFASMAAAVQTGKSVQLS